ncbi:MAG: hypothetical protein M3169_02495 [Candidatus Eremiobacteraeota bacterium]|nr:hypothetical protein [Candidatus Eremiobacteraeota bacterium]
MCDTGDGIEYREFFADRGCCCGFGVGSRRNAGDAVRVCGARDRMTWWPQDAIGIGRRQARSSYPRRGHDIDDIEARSVDCNDIRSGGGQQIEKFDRAAGVLVTGVCGGDGKRGAKIESAELPWGIPTAFCAFAYDVSSGAR